MRKLLQPIFLLTVLSFLVSGCIVINVERKSDPGKKDAPASKEVTVQTE